MQIENNISLNFKGFIRSLLSNTQSIRAKNSKISSENINNVQTKLRQTQKTGMGKKIDLFA